MYIPPPETPLPPEFWKNEMEYRRSKLRNGGLAGELLLLLWYLVKWVILVVPSLSVSSYPGGKGRLANAK